MSRLRFHPAPEGSPRAPWAVALALGLCSGAVAIDSLIAGQPRRALLALAGLGLAGLVALAGRSCRGAAVDPTEGDDRRDAPRLARGRSGGFTLIEVMVTLVITVSVFAMIGGILLSVLTTSEKIETKLRTEKAGYGILGTLRRDLTGLYAYALEGAPFKAEDRTEVGKDADELMFVTSAPVLESADGLPARFAEIGYKVQADDRGNLVLFRRAAALEGDPLGGAGNYVEICRDVQSFQLEFLDPETKEWVERWDKETVPGAIRCVVELILDEQQQAMRDEGQIDVPNPRYEMVVGIVGGGAIPEDAQAEGGEGGQGGAPPHPGG